jgi:hypothetical protein
VRWYAAATWAVQDSMNGRGREVGWLTTRRPGRSPAAAAGACQAGGRQARLPPGRPLRLNISDKNRRYIGKSQSKRPPKRTQRPPHVRQGGLVVRDVVDGGRRPAGGGAAQRRAHGRDDVVDVDAREDLRRLLHQAARRAAPYLREGTPPRPLDPGQPQDVQGRPRFFRGPRPRRSLARQLAPLLLGAPPPACPCRLGAQLRLLRHQRAAVVAVHPHRGEIAQPMQLAPPRPLPADRAPRDRTQSAACSVGLHSRASPLLLSRSHLSALSLERTVPITRHPCRASCRARAVYPSPMIRMHPGPCSAAQRRRHTTHADAAARPAASTPSPCRRPLRVDIGMMSMPMAPTRRSPSRGSARRGGRQQPEHWRLMAPRGLFYDAPVH